MRALAFTLLPLLLVASLAGASDWPLTRGDERRTGAAPELLPPPVAVAWIADLGAPVAGEPVVSGCLVVVTTTDGRTLAFNARNGTPLWEDVPAWAGAPPADATSDLAFLPDGRLACGLPADPAIPHLWQALEELAVGCEAYAVDYNYYPAGPELAPDITPIYLPSMPLNPTTGLEMAASDDPSPGDYRYEQVDGGTRFDLAAWWTDGLVLAPPIPAPWICAFDPPPPWPHGDVRGGSPTFFDPASGTVLSRDTSTSATTRISPLPVGTSTVWAAAEIDASRNANGRIFSVAASGATEWEVPALGPVRGPLARDAASQRLFGALGETQDAERANGLVRALATACEAFAVDYNAYPPTGELAGLIDPFYIKCLPPNLYGQATITWSASPSPGDYYYESLAGGQEYQLWLWDRDGQAIAVFSNGVFVTPALDAPPAIVALDGDGTVAWRSPVAGPGADIGPPLLLDDATVVVGTSSGEVVALSPTDGSELWRRSLGGDLARPAALAPDGRIVWSRDDGALCVFHPPYGATFYCDVTAAGEGAPATPTADGLLRAKRDGRLRAEGWTAPYGLRWEVPLGGVAMLPLASAPVLANGWIYVVRADGRFFALAEAADAGAPDDPGGTLHATKGEYGSVTLSWPEASLPASTLGLHFHLLRRATPDGPAEQILVPHPSAAVGFVDGGAGAVAFYELVAADCGENES